MSFELFENIELKNLKTLYQIIEKNFKYLDSVKLQYSRHSAYLQETLNFLVDANLISITDNYIRFLIKQIRVLRIKYLIILQKILSMLWD